MSFGDGLSATANVSMKAALNDSINEIVDRFKKHCEEKAADGFFESTKTYTFQTDEQPARHGFGKGGFGKGGRGLTVGCGKGGRGMFTKALPSFTVKACLMGKQAEFEKQLSDEINSLGFKEISVSVTWPAHDAGRGQIKFNANWPSKRSRGVKREREPFSF